MVERNLDTTVEKVADVLEEAEQKHEEGQEEKQPLTKEEMKKLLEAALFMAPKTLSIEELKQAFSSHNLSEKHIFDLVKELQDAYLNKASSIEITINEEDMHFGMRVKQDYLAKVKHLASESEFHKGVQKTLALIAFKQPIKQNLVIKYRNNKAYDHIHLLEEKGLVSRQRSGRTYILRTTKKFLDYFGDIKQHMKKAGP